MTNILLGLILLVLVVIAVFIFAIGYNLYEDDKS
jgi:nitrogen fixation-related uncharacterized protein